MKQQSATQRKKQEEKPKQIIDLSHLPSKSAPPKNATATITQLAVVPAVNISAPPKLLGKRQPEAKPGLSLDWLKKSSSSEKSDKKQKRN